MTRRTEKDCSLGKCSVNLSSDGRIVYKGNWRNDQPHGEGVYRFRNGDIYAGLHDDGDYHGTGRFVGIDGTEYQGEWVKGKRHGKAVFYSKKTGIATVGLWESDKFVKYISHKVVSETLPGQKAEPLQEGFDWNAYRGIVPHTHGDADPKKHSQDCNDCEHHHHHTEKPTGMEVQEPEQISSRVVPEDGVHKMEEEKIVIKPEQKTSDHNLQFGNQPIHHHHHDGRVCNHKH